MVAISIESDGETFDTADDGCSWLSSLVGLRADIANGDERALYLAWLLDVQCGVIDDEVVEPARPEGLGALSPALESLVDIIGLDRALVAVAAEGSPRAEPSSVRAVDRWLSGLTTAEHVGLLFIEAELHTMPEPRRVLLEVQPPSFDALACIGRPFVL